MVGRIKPHEENAAVVFETFFVQNGVTISGYVGGDQLFLVHKIYVLGERWR